MKSFRLSDGRGGDLRGCGTMRPIGEMMLYQHGMGAILRCADCDTALMPITHIRGCYRLDLSGMTCLRIASEIH